ncbi:MAG: S-layer homology domain-containing protein [Caldiserica bacterium]|nr:S-layer homology domain-containing protein [Caldisericota bacterium]
MKVQDVSGKSFFKAIMILLALIIFLPPSPLRAQTETSSTPTWTQISSTPTSTETPTTPTTTETLTTTTPTSTKTTTPSSNNGLFPDIVGHPAEQAIRHLWVRGLISGFPDGTFRPDDFLTRAEFAKLLILSLGAQTLTPTLPSFSDVLPSYWAFPYIEAGRHLGIRPFFLFQGFPDGTFRPKAYITIAEALTLIARSKGWEDALRTTTPSSPFEDVPINHWAFQEIYSCLAYGVVQSDKVFPDDPLPRGQAALYFFRAIDQPAIKSIYISLSEQRLYALEGARIVYEFPTLTGKQGWPTPTGIFYVLEKVEAVDMQGGLGMEEYYVPGVPWVLFFISRVYAIHGNYWKPERYFGNDPTFTGSHGCVGLIPDQARLLYDWTSVGTKIIITWDYLRYSPGE